MKLYYSPGACSLSPHIVLRESGLKFEPVLASTKTHKLQDGTDFYTINPKGYVPVLELDNGERLTEGPAIVQYLADQVPDKKLAPANGTFARSRLQEWLNFTTSEIHKTYSPLFNPATSAEFAEDRRGYLKKRYQVIEKQLQGREYLVGNQFTVADAYLFTVTSWAPHVKVDLAGFPNLQAFQQRVGARPAVQTALREEGLLK